MISRFIAPTYALEYQKNHCSPLLCKAMGAFPTWYQQSFWKMPLSIPPQVCMGTGRKHLHIGDKLYSTHLKATQSGSWTYGYIAPSMQALAFSVQAIRSAKYRALLDGHVNGCIYHLLIALWNSADYAIVGRLESLRGNLSMFLCASRRVRLNAFPG